MELEHMLEIPLDYCSVIERLGEIEDYPYEGVQSDYYWDYADLFNEMSIIAAHLYNELERLARNLDYSWGLPIRKLKGTDMEKASGASWFNLVTSMLEDTDMAIMLENEGVFDYEDIDAEKGRRRRAILALTKEQSLTAVTEVFNFLMRFMKLSLAFETIKGSIDEMERLNTFRERNGIPLIPDAAYL